MISLRPCGSGLCPSARSSREAVDPFSSSSVQLEDAFLIGPRSSVLMLHLAINPIGDLTGSPRHVGLAGPAVYVTSCVCRRRVGSYKLLMAMIASISKPRLSWEKIVLHESISRASNRYETD